MAKKKITKKNSRGKRGKAQRTETPDTPPGLHKPAEFKHYGLFMALPHEERKEIFGFSTDRQFGAKFKVRPATLSEWKTRADLWEIRDQYLLVFKKHTADIINALAQRAKRTGEAFHSLTFLKVVEGFTEKSGLDLTSRGKKISGFQVIVRQAANVPTSSRNQGS